MQHNARTAIAHRIHLDLRRGAWHDDGSLHAHLLGRHGETLCMVARRCRDDTTLTFGLRKPVHLVIGTAQLERKHGLQVFALQPHLVAKAPRQQQCLVHGGLPGDIVNARVENALDVGLRHGVAFRNWANRQW